MRDTVLVTGGAGFIGSHVCKALSTGGFLPVAYDNLSNGHEWAVRWGPLERGELDDAARLAAVFERYRPSAVLHFAALIEAGMSVIDPARFYANNVGGLLGLLDAMRKHDVDKLVFSSTAAVYGTPQRTPIDEDHPVAPINPYGATKMMCETMLGDFGRAYGLNSVALRYFNAAGADPEGELGEAHEPETHLIPLVLDAAAGRRSHITIFGTDYPTQDGTCIRDYVHVSDLASAHTAALAFLRSGEGTYAFNLGNGRGHTVREVIDTARAVTGRTVHTKLAARRPGDPAALVADAARAQRTLGWKPVYSDLRLQLEHAWNWLSGSRQSRRQSA